MTEITPQPEKQAIKQFEQQQLEARQEAGAKIAQAQDATPGARPVETGSESEKLKLATADKGEGGALETKISKAGDVRKSTIWESGPAERGIDYEKRLKGANIGGNYPVIDDFQEDTGTVTSYKTIDLNSKTYTESNPQSSVSLESTLKGYTDKLADFQGRTWHLDGETIQITEDRITERVLCVGIPQGSVTPERQQVFDRCKEYAAQRNVKLVIEEVA